MSTKLPGSNLNDDLVSIALKSTLGLIGYGHLSDCVSILTGLEKNSIETLSRTAINTISGRIKNEFTQLDPADKRWAEILLTRTYSRLAQQRDREFILQCMTGPTSLASWAFGAGMEDSDHRELKAASNTTREYYRLLSLTMADLIYSWYSSNKNATQKATLVSLSALLNSVNEISDRIKHIGATIPPRPDSPKDRDISVISSRAIKELIKPPEYYPKNFDNKVLASNLNIVELNEDNFFQFEGKGLYWDGHFYGKDLKPNLDLVLSNNLSVILGNPGSGKTTLLKHLTLCALEAGSLALYCRLEDFAYTCSEITESPLIAALLASANSIGLDLELNEAGSIADSLKYSFSQAVILLDGLDELASAEQYSTARIAALRLSKEGYKVVIASRVSGYSNPWDAVNKHYAIKPLSEQAQKQFVENWFYHTKSSIAKKRYEEATHQDGISSVLSNPLTLGFVCMLAHYEQVPSTAASIFDRFVDHFLRAPWKSPRSQVIDACQIGKLKQDAENVAWSMANYGVDSSWADIADLTQLQRSTKDSSGYFVYATGLLIPHGSIEPLGGTHQKVRWLHRSLHENFVAQRLRHLIETQHSSCWRVFLSATCHPAWKGAVDQTYSLLNESGSLPIIMNYLMHEIIKSDTPQGHLVEVLSEAALHSSSRELRMQVVNTLLQVGKWCHAARIDTTTTVKAVRNEIAGGRRQFDRGLWRVLYFSNSSEVVFTLLYAYRMGCLDIELKWLVNWIGLNSFNSQERERCLDYLCTCADENDVAACYYSVEPLSTTTLLLVLASISARLNLRTRSSRLSLSRAYRLISSATLNRNLSIPSSFYDGRLRTAIELGDIAEGRPANNDVRQHDFGTLVDEDLLRFGSELINAEATPRVENLQLLKVLPILSWRDFHSSFPIDKLHITSVSQELAIEVLELASSGKWDFSWNRAELVYWSLEVLLQRPAVESIKSLIDFRLKELTGECSKFHSVIDSNFVTDVFNSQPWHILARKILKLSSGSFYFDALVLSMSALLSRSKFSARSRLKICCTLSDAETLECYLESLECLKMLGTRVTESMAETITCYFPLYRDEIDPILEKASSIVSYIPKEASRKLFISIEQAISESEHLADYLETLRSIGLHLRQ